MQFREETVFSLFSTIKSQLIVPDFQRAYLWENDQCRDFFNDLYEHSKSESNYSFGNIFVEENSDVSKTEIVDGLQRLATIVIFIRSLVDVLKEQKKLAHNDFNIEEMKRTFIKHNGKSKLAVSKIDQKYFENVILENGESNVKSESRERMRKAKQYFLRKIESVKSVSELKNIYEKLQKSIITITIIDNKTDSTLMFELQNNRGKYKNQYKRQNDKNSKGVPTSELIDNVYRLASMGWKMDEISTVFNLSIGEVELILELRSKT